jgi:murein DD-endopeptidase MepM/ murein hydrolase activator NlpD
MLLLALYILMIQTFTGNNSPKLSHFESKNSSHYIKLIVILALVVSSALIFNTNAFAVSSKTDPLAAAQAALDKANREANAAAIKYQEAYGNLSKVNDKVADVTSQIEQTEATLGQVKDKVTSRAINAYMNSSDKTYDDEYKEEIDNTRRSQLLDAVAEVDDNQISLYVALKEDLAITQVELTALQKNAKETLSNISAQKKALDTKLADAAKAKKAVETKIASDKKAAAAAAAAAAKKQQQAAKSSTKSSTPAGTVINPSNQKMVCPISGSLAFTNDWGQPRSGGRTHKGNDLFSPRGTTNVAIVAGSLTFQNSGLGGLSALIKSSDGYTYYYTHLLDIVGSPRQVVAGEVVGHTGSSGNASANAPHTHFEIWTTSYAKVNPYATLSSLC